MKELIAKRIREIRTERGLSQKKLGEMLSVSQDNVSLWENGKSIPTGEQIILMCKTFGISADYLLGLTD